MALKIQLTTAGRAALINAANTGTLPVLVAAVGVTATAFTATAGNTTLPGELKRLITFAGAAVADDTIHITIRDDSADSYSLRGFALYLADGQLFGLYGQATPILEKSAQAMLLLSSDIIFADIAATSLTFGDADWINPPASTDVQGVIEVATDPETIAGADPLRAVPPKGLKAALDARFGTGAPSAFVKGLLNYATAALFRSALAIKSAALKDDGAGNGLDADLLDGNHGAFYRDWFHLTNVPGSFPPGPHNHNASSITAGILLVPRGGTGTGSHTAGHYLVGNGTAGILTKSPEDVRDNIGAAAESHSHRWSDINAPPIQTERWPNWSEVGVKPNTFPPEPHNQAISTITGLQGALDDRFPKSGGTVSGPVISSGVSGGFDFRGRNDNQRWVWLAADGTARLWSPDAGYVVRIADGTGIWSFTASPTAPTPSLSDNSTTVATTAFVQALVSGVINGSPGALDTLRELAAAMGDDPDFAATVINALALKAPLASPTFSGSPKAPTPAAGNNTTQLATTAFVQAAIAAALSTALASYLPKNNPTFTGTMTGPAYNET